MMKTRELMTCDSGAFVRQTLTMKPKQLLRHIEKLGASLGEGDPEVLLNCVIKGLYPEEGADVPGDADMLAFDALAQHIPLTDANRKQLLRLTVLCLSLLKQGMRRAERENRQSLQNGPTGHDHGHCDDPAHGHEHGHHHGH